MSRLLVVPIVVSVLWAAQGPPSLPDYDSFVKQTRDNLERSQRQQDRYAYKERRTELHTNPFGRLGSGGMLVYEVTPIEGGDIVERRLIERDGKPVPNAPVNKTDLRERAQRRPTRRSGLDDSVAMLDFHLARRETVRGRSMIVVTFKPVPRLLPARAIARRLPIMHASA